MDKNLLLKIIKTYFFYITSAFGATLVIKAAIGVASFNTMLVAISEALEIRMGTVVIIVNMAFLTSYIFLTSFKKRKTYLAQLITIFIFGNMINYFLYDILGNYNFESYLNNLNFVIIGTIINGLSIGMIVHYDLVTLPVEGTCNEIAKRTKYAFSKIRYLLDLISIIVSISISLTSGLPLFVREGTVINMFLLRFSLAFVQKQIERRYTATLTT